jgi:hypothetical protein
MYDSGHGDAEGDLVPLRDGVPEGEAVMEGALVGLGVVDAMGVGDPEPVGDTEGGGVPVALGVLLGVMEGLGDGGGVPVGLGVVVGVREGEVEDVAVGVVEGVREGKGVGLPLLLSDGDAVGLPVALTDPVYEAVGEGVRLGGVEGLLVGVTEGLAESDDVEEEDAELAGGVADGLPLAVSLALTLLLSDPDNDVEVADGAVSEGLGAVVALSDGVGLTLSVTLAPCATATSNASKSSQRGAPPPRPRHPGSHPACRSMGPIHVSGAVRGRYGGLQREHVAGAKSAAMGVATVTFFSANHLVRPGPALLPRSPFSAQEQPTSPVVCLRAGHPHGRNPQLPRRDPWRYNVKWSCWHPGRTSRQRGRRQAGTGGRRWRRWHHGCVGWRWASTRP